MTDDPAQQEHNDTAETPASTQQEEQTSPQKTPSEATEASSPQESEQPPQPSPEALANKWKEAALRAAAELDNFRKRVAREKTEIRNYANQSLLEELLPVLDNFDMGMQAAASESQSMLFAGMAMVQKQIADFLLAHKVVEITTKSGDTFDPAIHEALSHEDAPDIPPGHIARVIRKGYYLGQERLLRPANVTIANEPS